MDITKTWPRQDGILLYAHKVSVLPPIEAVFALGSPAIDVWLNSYGRKRTDGLLSTQLDAATREYEIVWSRESAFRATGVFATLGGWHMAWPDDDFRDLLQDQLLLWTVRDAEPWVEVWRTAAGDLRVLSRIT